MMVPAHGNYTITWEVYGLGDTGQNRELAFPIDEMGVMPMKQGANSLFWNPAGLALAESGREYSVSYCNQLGLVPYSAGAGTHRLGSLTLGAALLYSESTSSPE